MSSFTSQSFEEAKLTFKPLKRSKMALGRSQMCRQGDSMNRRVKTLRSKPIVAGAHNSAGRPKAKRAKKISDGKLKKKVWKEFSIYIRTNEADSDGFNACFTCDARKHWKELQAGHFVRGRLNANLFDGRGCKPQCYSCNIGKQGNVIPYYKRMLKLYGQMVIDSLVTQNEQTRKWLAGELQDMLDRYKMLNALNPLTKKQE